MYIFELTKVYTMTTPRKLIGLLCLFYAFSVNINAQFDPAPALRGELYANSYGCLGTVNPNTGEWTSVDWIVDWQTEQDIINESGLAINSRGEMFVTSWNGDNPFSLLQVDPATGRSKTIALEAWSVPLKGITFDDNDALLALDWSNKGGDLYQINTETGTTKLLHEDVLPEGKYGSLEAHPHNGLLYSANINTGEIYNIKPETGTSELVYAGNASPGGRIGDLAFGADGELFAFTGSRLGDKNILPIMYRVDLLNQTTTRIGNLLNVSTDEPKYEMAINAAASYPAAELTEISSCSSGGEMSSSIIIEPVPTMGEWGLIILCNLLLIFAVSAIKQFALVYN